MRRMVLWDDACNFNAFISNQSILNCLITGASTLHSFIFSKVDSKIISSFLRDLLNSCWV